MFVNFGLRNETYNFGELWVSAILLQYNKAEFFQIDKRNIKNQEMIDNWGNAKIALPRDG